MGTADTAINVIDSVASVARLAAQIGTTALPIAQFVAGFFPGAAPVLQVLTIAAPYLLKVAEYAPVAEKAISAGRPILDAIDQAHPQLFDSFKNLFAAASGQDIATVSDTDVIHFASRPIMGRPWTDEEFNRLADRLSIGSQS